MFKKLNETIQNVDNCVFDLLSERGRTIFFPAKGILGQTAEAKGCEINATIGTAFEDDGSPLTLESLEDMITLPSESFLYAPSYGLPALRDTWKDIMYNKNPELTGKEISRPVVTSALTHGLSLAGYLFANKGDEILVPDLFWGNYKLIFQEACGASIKTFSMFKEGAFDVDALAHVLAAEGEKKILVLNFPNNPSGYTVTENEATAITEVIKTAGEAGKKILVLTDDAYFGLVYEEGILKESLFARLSDLHKNVLAVKLDGPTKEDYVWGFRVGFITFGIKNATAQQYKALEDKAAGAVRGNLSNCSSIGQHLLLKAYKNERYAAQKKGKFETLKARYLKVKEILNTHPTYAESFAPMPFNSGYFMCVKLNGAQPEAVRQELLASFSTGVIVLSGLIRLAFSAVPITQLEKLFANVDAAIRAVKARD